MKILNNGVKRSNKTFESFLKGKKYLNEFINKMIKKIEDIIDPALEFAIKANIPQSSINLELNDVFYQQPMTLVEPSNTKRELRLVDSPSCLKQKWKLIKI